MFLASPFSRTFIYFVFNFIRYDPTRRDSRTRPDRTPHDLHGMALAENRRQALSISPVRIIDWSRHLSAIA